MTKNVVITGGGSGQGFEHAKGLAQDGWRVFALDCEFERERREELSQAGIHVATVDVTEESQWQEFTNELHAIGVQEIHGLVNNAGVLVRDGIQAISKLDWERVLNVNLTGAFLGIQQLLPFLKRAHQSSIVNIGSQAGLFGHYATAYSVSKWGLRGLSKAVAVELGNLGVRSNCVLPGYIETDMNRSAPVAFRNAHLRSIPVHRFGNMQDVTAVVKFLLSDASEFLTGAEISVDGGQSAHGGSYRFEEFLG